MFAGYRILGILLIGVFFNASYVGAGWFSSDKPQATQEKTKPVPKEQSKPVAQPAQSPPVQAAQPKSEPKQKPATSGKSVSEITWSEVHKKFIKTEKLTSAQKEKLEKDRKQWWQENYKGKWVRWRGGVNKSLREALKSK
jgi:hypothetical protein